MSRATVGRAVIVIALCVMTTLGAGCGGSSQSADHRGSSTATPGSGAYGGSGSVPAPDQASVKQTIRAFYASITDDDLQGAWAVLTPSLRDVVGGYEKWAGAYNQTQRVAPTSIEVTSLSASSASAAVSIRAVDLDACQAHVVQTFTGTWKLVRRNDSWRARDVTMHKTSGATPVRDATKCSGPGPPVGGSNRRGGGPTTRVCYPGVDLPAVHLPAVTLPAVPSLGIPAQHVPGQTIPGQRIPGTCLDAPQAFEPQETTVTAPEAYSALDSDYSPQLTSRYWSSAPDAGTPDPTAPGFGELNAAGYPRNQYVRPYMRRDGTMVSGYWRNSPNDGLPTCQVVSC
jgi:hypothetical protein